MARSERRILITGGAGFIGPYFVRFVMHERPKWRIVNYDALTYAGNPANLADIADDPRYEFVHGDIRDRDDLLAALTDRKSVV